MDNQKYQIIAVISVILTIIAFSSLVLRVHMTKESEHLTFTWIFLVLKAQSLLVIYGVINNSYGIYVPAVILLIGVLYILYIKLNYDNVKRIEDELKSKNILTN
jgi:Na+/melibiose symporter-like transporter